MPRLDKRGSEPDILRRVEARLGSEALPFALVEYLQQFRQALVEQFNTLRSQTGLQPLGGNDLPRITRQQLVQALRQQLREERENG